MLASFKLVNLPQLEQLGGLTHEVPIGRTELKCPLRFSAGTMDRVNSYYAQKHPIEREDTCSLHIAGRFNAIAIVALRETTEDSRASNVESQTCQVYLSTPMTELRPRQYTLTLDFYSYSLMGGSFCNVVSSPPINVPSSASVSLASACRGR